MKKLCLVLLLLISFVFVGCSKVPTVAFAQNADGSITEFYRIPYMENELINAGLQKEKSSEIKTYLKLQFDELFNGYLTEFTKKVDENAEYTEKQKQYLKDGVKLTFLCNDEASKNIIVDTVTGLMYETITCFQYTLTFKDSTCYKEFKNVNTDIKEQRETIVEKSLFLVKTKVVKDPLFDSIQQYSNDIKNRFYEVEEKIPQIIAGDGATPNELNLAKSRWELIKRAVNYPNASSFANYCYIVPTARIKSNANRVLEQDGYYWHIWTTKVNNYELPENEQIKLEYWTIEANKPVWYGFAVLSAVVVMIVVYIVAKNKKEVVQQPAQIKLSAEQEKELEEIRKFINEHNDF